MTAPSTPDLVSRVLAAIGETERLSFTLDVVLRHCAADRRILDLHRQVPADVAGADRDEPTGCQICGKALMCDWIEGNGVCDTVLALAEGYDITPEED